MNTNATADQFQGIEPLRPWAITRSARLKNLLRSLVFAFVAFVVTLVTPLANIDGWAFAFLLVNVVWVVGQTARLGAKERRDAVLRVVFTSLAVLAFVPWLSIFLTVLLKGYTAIYPGYFFSDMRTSTPEDEFNIGGAGHAIVGSLIMVAIATVITLPLGILSGIYLTEVRGRMTFLVRFIVQSMAGVPSVVA